MALTNLGELSKPTKRAPLHGARIGLQRPGEHFHEGALPGSVFTHKGVDLSCMDFEVDSIECHRGAEALSDATHFQARRRGI